MQLLDSSEDTGYRIDGRQRQNRSNGWVKSILMKVFFSADSFKGPRASAGRLFTRFIPRKIMQLTQYARLIKNSHKRWLRNNTMGRPRQIGRSWCFIRAGWWLFGCFNRLFSAGKRRNWWASQHPLNWQFSRTTPRARMRNAFRD